MHGSSSQTKALPNAITLMIIQMLSSVKKSVILQLVKSNKSKHILKNKPHHLKKTHLLSSLMIYAHMVEHLLAQSKQLIPIWTSNLKTIGLLSLMLKKLWQKPIFQILLTKYSQQILSQHHQKPFPCLTKNLIKTINSMWDLS